MTRRSENERPFTEAAAPAPYPLDDALEAAFSRQPRLVSDTGEWLDRQTTAEEIGSPNGVISGRDGPTDEQFLARTRIKDRAAAGEVLTIQDELAILPQWQARFVLALMENAGNFGLATNQTGISRSVVEKHRKLDSTFDDAINQAIEHSSDIIEAHGYRRATIGEVQPIYQGGILAGYKRVASDKALEIMLRVRGRLKDEQQVNVTTTGRVEMVHSADVPAKVAAAVARLYGPAPVIEIEGESVSKPDTKH